MTVEPTTLTIHMGRASKTQTEVTYFQIRNTPSPAGAMSSRRGWCLSSVSILR